MSTLRDRLEGAFWGLATGDALGAPLEFYKRDALPEVRNMIGGGKFRLPPGAWTDDTSMALCLADSLAKFPELNSEHLLNCFWTWASENAHCSQPKAFGFGQNTIRTLLKFYNTGQTVASSTGTRSDGNGSVMRLAPVAIRHHNDLSIVQELSRQQSYTTHASEKGADCCELLGAVLFHLFHGQSLDKALERLSTERSKWDPLVQDLVTQTWKTKGREEISSSGYVIHTLEAALWSVYHSNSFEDALILAVNLGNDADTVGAVTGQIAGAMYGKSNIPSRWLNALIKPDMLSEVLNSILPEE